jgi:transposase
MKKRIIRYSEAFKLEVVSVMESGEVEGIPQAMKRFGITGSTTVKNWLSKYGKNHLIPKVIRVERPNEKRCIEELRKENERLKKALADSHMDALLYQSWFELACEKFGVKDTESFKKKLEKK